MKLFPELPPITDDELDRVRKDLSNIHKVRLFAKTADGESLKISIMAEGTRSDGRIRVEVLKTLINALNRIREKEIFETIYQIHHDHNS